MARVGHPRQTGASSATLWRPEAAQLHAEADAVRKVFQGGYMIRAMKHAVSTFAGYTEWRAVRPPLVELDA